MFRRILFGNTSSPDSNHESPQAPIITVVDAVSRPEAAPSSGMRRSAAAANLLDLEDTLEKMNTQSGASTVTIVRAFRAAVTVTTSTENDTKIMQLETSSFLSKRKGYELEDTGCSISVRSSRLSAYYTDESSSDHECPASHHHLLDTRPGIRSFSNTPDPDHLDDIWHGRITPK